MCFMVYVGTEKALALKDWRKDAPSLWVRPLVEQEIVVRSHFSKPIVQYVGATSSCGCDFPHSLLTNGEWLKREDEDPDPEQEEIYFRNGKSLADLFRKHGEGTLELYCFWAGNGAKPPLAKETVSLQVIAEPDFRFREQVFYGIQL